MNDTNALPSTTAVRAGGFSQPRLFDADFVAGCVRTVFDALPQFVGCNLELIGQTPYWAKSPDHASHLLILRSRCMAGACIGIEFGGSDTRASLRTPVKEGEWQWDPSFVYTSGICVASWDEAWAFICQIGERLEVTSVSLRYGF